MVRGRILILVVAWTSLALGQQGEPGSGAVRLEIRFAGGPSEFRQGEVIALELLFSASERQRYNVDLATYDRSGRLGIDEFVVSPVQGTSDPLRAYFGAANGLIGGGLRGYRLLSEEPVVVRREVNEWVRFDEPGTYQLSVISRRVSDIRDVNQPSGRVVIKSEGP